MRSRDRLWPVRTSELKELCHRMCMTTTLTTQPEEHVAALYILYTRTQGHSATRPPPVCLALVGTPAAHRLNI